MKKIIWGVCLALIMAIGVARSATLTDDEQDKCTAGGGCVFVTKANLDELAAKVYHAGLERGRISCGNRT